jgi:hypothetical protein
MTGPRAGIGNRDGLPHRWSPKIVHLCWKQRLGPVAIGDQLGLASSTVHAVLVRCRLNRLSHIDGSPANPSNGTSTHTRARCCIPLVAQARVAAKGSASAPRMG